jgi:propionyl-CoA carboxylase alpha chain
MISKLLVANRGEIVVRIARTCRDMGIATVGIYSDPDRDAVHVRACDEAIALGGAAPSESYLLGDAIIAAAQRTGADAIHPGFGFLAENAEFARAVVDAGLVWVGPHPDAIAAMGDKLEAKRIMAGAGVPLLPSIEVDEDTDLDAAAGEVGLPLMVKATAGGGGKGMRIVQTATALADEVAAARREAAGAFGDDRVFLERYVARPRHVEVQVLGDGHGNVVHLFERECSIQRRHQKVVEETPSTALTPQLREEMGAAAVAAARAIGYDNAGTVEFILAEEGDFRFLEMNTRLQVEHPVTEEVVRFRAPAGAPVDGSAEPRIDLVRLQLQVAAGEPLPFTQDDVVQRGHAIEVRLYAEDPANDYLPATGTLHAFVPARGDGIRWDAGVETGSVVSPHYDPMLAKVIARAPSRSEAARRLARELDATVLHGVVTNRDLLSAILREEAFLEGDTTTAYLDERFAAPSDRRSAPNEDLLRTAAIAAALDGARQRMGTRRTQRTIPSGWRNNRGQDQSVRYRHDEREIEVSYRAERDGTWSVSLDGREPVRVRHEPRGLEIEERHVEVTISSVDGPPTSEREIHVSTVVGSVTLGEVPRFPRAGLKEIAGAAVSPMPGAVVEVAVAEGDEVSAGDLLVVVEAMKMEHRVAAAHDGIVDAVHSSEGQQVDSGEVLVVVLQPD